MIVAGPDMHKDTDEMFDPPSSFALLSTAPQAFLISDSLTLVLLFHLYVDLGLVGNGGYVLVAQGLLRVHGRLLDEAGCVLVSQGLPMVLSCFVLKVKFFRRVVIVSN